MPMMNGGEPVAELPVAEARPPATGTRALPPLARGEPASSEPLRR